MAAEQAAVGEVVPKSLEKQVAGATIKTMAGGVTIIITTTGIIMQSKTSLKMMMHGEKTLLKCC